MSHSNTRAEVVYKVISNLWKREFCLEKVIVCPVYATPVLVWIVSGARTESLASGRGFFWLHRETKVMEMEVKNVLILALGIANTKGKKGQRDKRGREEQRKTKKLNRCSDVVAI